MFKPNRFPKSTKSDAKVYASVRVLIFAPIPVGISITTCVAPIAFFLLRIDGKSIGSMPKGYSTWMKRSSAGARSKAPPQTRQPLVFATTFLISSMVKFTGQRVSTLSAVPEGEVIAREEVLGIVYPAAATMGTTSMLVLSPGIPPTLCLSRMGPLPKSIVFPVATIALDNASFSLVLKPWMLRAVKNAAISTLLKCRSTTSLTMLKTSFSRRRSPCNLARTLNSDSGRGANWTLTVSSSFTPSASMVSW